MLHILRVNSQKGFPYLSRYSNADNILKENTFTLFEIQTWLFDLILRINPFKIFCA